MAVRTNHKTPMSYCNGCAILFERDLTTGEKRILKVFRTLKQAKIFRNEHLAAKALKMQLDPSFLFPIERHYMHQTGRGLT